MTENKMKVISKLTLKMVKFLFLNMCPKVNDIVELNEKQRLIVLNVKRVR